MKEKTSLAVLPRCGAVSTLDEIFTVIVLKRLRLQLSAPRSTPADVLPQHG